MSQSPIRIIIRVRAQGTGKAVYNSTRYGRALAERGGFEPPIRLPVCRISSAVLSTTQPPLHAFDPVGQFGARQYRNDLLCYRIATFWVAECRFCSAARIASSTRAAASA